MRIIAIATLAVALALGGALALAQSSSDPAVGERLQAALKERAETRPRLRPPPIGRPAKETVEDGVNWTEMRTAVAVTAAREAAAGQSITTAPGGTAGIRAAAPERLKNVVTREVNVTRLPVLAPDTARVRATLKVYSLGSSYSATAEVEDGVAMRMSGTRKKLVVGDLKSARSRITAMRAEEKSLPGLDVPYIVARSDNSTDLSFAKFGAGYVLSLMCDDPSDARCAEDGFIVALASNLILLNSEAEGE